MDGSDFDCASGSAAASATTAPAANMRNLISAELYRAIVPPEGGSHTFAAFRRALRAALAVENHGRELLILGEIDEVLRARLGLGQALEVGEHLFDAAEI